MIAEPGLYTMTAADYHADPAPTPSLSSSIARELLARSPWHAWCAHPRLNPAYLRDDDEKFDLGTAAHAYLLEGESGFEIIDAPDWRTKAAQMARVSARLAGRTPLLTEQWARVQEMVTATGRQLSTWAEPPIPFTSGKPEQTLIWREQDVWCRARLDWLHDGYRVVDDYKSTLATANPDAWARGLFGMGYDLQAAFYLRGLRAVCGTEAQFRFVAQETFVPYALAVIGLGPEALALAEKKIAFAIELWAECLNTNTWPGYPRRTCYVQAPAWAEAQWLERQYRDGRPEQPLTPEDDGRSLEEQLFGDSA